MVKVWAKTSNQFYKTVINTFEKWYESFWDRFWPKLPNICKKKLVKKKYMNK